MSTDEIHPRLLSGLRDLREVADDLRLPPPPLPDVRRRAGRLRRARLTRRAAGGATALAVLAAGVAVARVDGGPPVLERVQLAGTVVPQPAPDAVCTQTPVYADDLRADLLRLPAQAPGGLRFYAVSTFSRDTGCGYPALSAWRQAEMSSRIDRRIQVTVTAPGTTPFPGSGRCAAIALEGQPGRCTSAVVGGRERPVWRVDAQAAHLGDKTLLGWVDGGYLWQFNAYGLDEAALHDVLRGLRTTAGGRIDGSVPAGFDAWQPPSGVTPWSELVASYVPPDYSPQDPAPPRPMVSVRVSDGPGTDPFADPLMSASGNSPDVQPQVVDVDGRMGVWYLDRLNDQTHLVWRAGDGVTVSVAGDLTLDLGRALGIARDIRAVRVDDPRLRGAVRRS
jgi:hypothetical protein